MDSRILIPVRYAAWLSGDLGRNIQATLNAALDARITRLPRGLLVEADEAPGPLLEMVHRAMVDVEDGVRRRYPVFHHEMGPVWTRTLQVVFPEDEHPASWTCTPISTTAAPTPTSPGSASGSTRNDTKASTSCGSR